ncbi:hypothetical protein T492DRAFT_834973 [Pavlovales sp. CCMP2436]|nr:hypothetical protein T492DRAFT_834973 [Pavlovales sp. CCMP2436]
MVRPRPVPPLPCSCPWPIFGCVGRVRDEVWDAVRDEVRDGPGCGSGWSGMRSGMRSGMVRGEVRDGPGWSGMRSGMRSGMVRDEVRDAVRGVMSSAAELALRTLAASAPEARGPCVETVRLLLSNILEHPTEAKYRRVKTSNPRFSAAVLAVAGGRELLLAAGFVQDGDALLLPDGAGVHAARGVLAALRNGGVPVPAAPQSAVASQPAPPLPASAAPSAPAAVAAPLPAAMDGEPDPMNAADSMDVDDEAELQAALQMSMAIAASAQPQPAPAPAPAGEGLEAAIRRHFSVLTASGLAPNDAAVKALELAQADLASAAAAASSAAASAARASAPAAAAGAGGSEGTGESGEPVEFVRFDADSVATAASQLEQYTFV